MKIPHLLTTLALLISNSIGEAYDAHHIRLDQSLSDAEAAKSPYLFNEVRAALTAINNLDLPETDTILFEIAPGVYWVDDPDDPTIRRGNLTGNTTPYGFELKSPCLNIVGLCEDARDVVLACNRGQTQGAIGNFTMLRLDCPHIKVQNITFGNYCSVDLDYPRDRTKNRPRRAQAIVQAQLLHTSAKFVQADNCRFISRLNLCPFHGVYRALFNECHFECTDDALEGAAIYKDCHFDFYSNKPFWATPDCGAVFLDCQIDTRVVGTQYFIKTTGPLALIRTSINQVDGKPLNIVPNYSPNDAPCYYSDVKVNGKPAIVENAHDISNVAFLRGFTVENLLNGPFPTYMKILPDDGSTTIGEKEDSKTLQFKFYCWNGQPATQRIATSLLVYAALPSGLSGSTRLNMEADLHPAPTFIKEPTLTFDKKQGALVLDYELTPDVDERTQICWYRYTADDQSDAIPVRYDWMPNRKVYLLKHADVGYRFKVVITPKYFASKTGRPSAVLYDKPIPDNIKGIKLEPIAYHTDFQDVPVFYQPVIRPGCWTFDAYKPFDTQAYFWSVIPEHCWFYGPGMDGAAESVGIVQASRGARCFYTPDRKKSTDMEVNVQVVPAKTAGQGFGSATGQYMDIGIKFDPATLTGYALRIQRTPFYDKACSFQLIQYEGGKTKQLGKSVISSCYKGCCDITVSLKGNTLTATAHSDQPSEDVNLSISNVKVSSHSAFYIQHTGSIGPSASLIKEVSMKWK